MKSFYSRNNFNFAIILFTCSGAFIALVQPIPNGGKESYVKCLIFRSKSNKNVLYGHFLEVIQVLHSTVIIIIDI